jgi:beta-glucosidase
LTPVYEGEEGDAFLAPNGGDKLSLDLPAAHVKLLKQLRQKGKPVVAVVTAGSAVDIASIAPYADAILLAWYPGEQGGTALADLLFGKVAPSGRLPVTFYQSLKDLPPYSSYAVKGRTYRYFNGPVQYPFGFGLSYTSFNYRWVKEPKAPGSLKDSISFSVAVKNTGSMDGDEVVQVYIRYPGSERMPLKELKAFRRITVKKGEERMVQLSIAATELQKWNLTLGRWQIYPGTYEIMVGASSEDSRLKATIAIPNLK